MAWEIMVGFWYIVISIVAIPIVLALIAGVAFLAFGMLMWICEDFIKFIERFAKTIIVSTLVLIILFTLSSLTGITLTKIVEIGRNNPNLAAVVSCILPFVIAIGLAVYTKRHRNFNNSKSTEVVNDKKRP